MSPEAEDAFHNASFGYGVTKKQAKLLAQEIYAAAKRQMQLEATINKLKADLDGQRELVAKLTEKVK